MQVMFRQVQTQALISLLCESPSGYNRCFLVGHDWGGIIAWLFAIHYPEMVVKLVVLNSPHPCVFAGKLSNLLFCCSAEKFPSSHTKPKGSILIIEHISMISTLKQRDYCEILSMMLSQCGFLHLVPVILPRGGH